MIVHLPENSEKVYYSLRGFSGKLGGHKPSEQAEIFLLSSTWPQDGWTPGLLTQFSKAILAAITK